MHDIQNGTDLIAFANRMGQMSGTANGSNLPTTFRNATHISALVLSIGLHTGRRTDVIQIGGCRRDKIVIVVGRMLVEKGTVLRVGVAVGNGAVGTLSGGGTVPAAIGLGTDIVTLRRRNQVGSFWNASGLEECWGRRNVDLFFVVAACIIIALMFPAFLSKGKKADY